MADFDAIVVGMGCAGSVAAYELAKAGKSVLAIERGNFAGAKNMTGGRIYAHSLMKVFPEFRDEAPLERKIVHEKISMLDEKGCFTIDFSSDAMSVAENESYSVLRGEFDQWLAEKAEAEGVEIIYGIAVEELIKEGNRVVGVKAGEDEITAEVVILCDGVNSLLTESAVGYARPKPSQLAVGVKQVIELDEKTVSDRMLVDNDDEGTAWLFAGDATKGHIGGGFMYSNRTSISLGLVATIEDLYSSDKPIYQMLEEFKAHPSVAPLIRGGKVVEHSGHMVPEGGFNMMPELIGDGVILAGESAMMCINLGYMVRGMDYAIAAGQEAGIAAAKAIDAGDTSKAGLKGYVDALENSFVLKDLKQFQNFPHVMESTPRIFNEYPKLAVDVMNELFIVNGEPVQSPKKAIMPHIKSIGYMNLFKDLRGAMKAL